MGITSVFRSGLLVGAACLLASGQNPPAKEAQPEAKGMPPRAAATDYLAQTAVGPMTLAAEFKGHSIPTLQGTLTSDAYVVVEVAMFGPAGSHLTLSIHDFALRINSKKQPTPSQGYVAAVSSLRDPEWVSPDEQKKKESKTSIGGGGGEEGHSTTTTVKIPVEMARAWAQRVQRVTLPEGDRPLPQAGVLFFPYRGKAEGIHELELIYTGPAGNATLPLEP